MRPLTLDDLLPLDEFAARRGEFVAAHRRYCEQYRRIRIGPHITLTFENRQTLWFRVQELLRVMRLEEPRLVREELDRCNRLLPRRDHLMAGLALSRDAEPGGSDNYSICLIAGESRRPACLLPCWPEDQALGYVTWAEFAVLAAELTGSVSIAVEFYGEWHDSGPLQDDVRQSLIDDLTISERDAA
jgi:hypothetical protein